MIYLCENNQYAVSTPAARATALAHLADRAAGIPMPGVTVDASLQNHMAEAVTKSMGRSYRRQ